jgi:outer membrane protein assembly factor BamA
MKLLLLRHHFLVYFALLALGQSASGQYYSAHNLNLELGFAAELPMGADLSAVFPSGVATHIGLEINTLKNKLYLKPKGGISFFNHYYSVSGQESLIQWDAGLDARYYLRTVSDSTTWNFYPSVGISYSGFNNTIGPQPGYVGGVRNMTSGNGMNYMAALGVLYRRFHLEIGYNWYTPTVKIDPDLAASFNENVGIYQPYTFNDTKMDLSRIRLEMGFKIPIK